jgi:hypothetical protein
MQWCSHVLRSLDNQRLVQATSQERDVMASLKAQLTCSTCTTSTVRQAAATGSNCTPFRTAFVVSLLLVQCCCRPQTSRTAGQHQSHMHGLDLHSTAPSKSATSSRAATGRTLASQTKDNVSAGCHGWIHYMTCMPSVTNHSCSTMSISPQKP